MTQIVYTLGYTGRKIGEIEALVQEKEAVLVDIRFSPRSRNPTWNGGNLRQVFGARYKHVRAFGNENYKGGPIKIVDFDAGLAFIRRSGRPMILMCACKSYEHCHRKHLADRLRALGFTTQELGPAPPPASQERLF